MISSYGDFIDELETMIKYRSKNYVNTDCNIHVITSSVYDELVSDVKLFFFSEEIILENGVYEYQILDVKTDPNNTDEIVSYYKNIESAVDSNFEDCDLFIDEHEDYTITINDERFLSENANKSIYLMREEVIDLRFLPVNIYQMIKSAMLEGIMFHIQTSIPSQTDSNLGNLQYQRFFNARELLKKKLPQTGRFDSRKTGSQAKRSLL